ncbi:dehydrogenase [Enemella dayhoffiae]|uniref:Dehydrogenase n=1 Tax=Enemella dayhoffiae TaxID=2016507 RepID=A0A255GX24_9ACTN|nr:NAD(P)-dependent oxidoreductase [Enemella dayhoffiae]OYO18134.1 dehydrogenase [Enemella dayhoffiae]
MTTIGVVAPGAMGAALGRAWVAAGHDVVVTVAGRSERTRSLAHGLRWLDSLTDVAAAADVVVSVVPPARALGNAEQIADACRSAGVRPLVADLNAVSPAEAEQVAAVLAAAGCDPVDGAISGPPPELGKRTTVFVSGERAGELAGLGADGLSVRVVGERVGQASAVKMCTAAVYKGITALLMQSLRTAGEHGVQELVLEDLTPGLGWMAEQAPMAIAVAVAKSDRFPYEMGQIADTQEQAGVGGELFRAFAEVYQRSNDTSLAELTPEQAAELVDLDRVLQGLRTPRQR